jgi:hypothetical protein
MTGSRTLQLLVLTLLVCATSGCERFENWLFQRHSPVVDRAVHAIESKDAGDAHQLLADYLSTGRCKGGTLGTPDSVRDLPNASLDLGLALFDLAERYGQKFGQEPAPSPQAQQHQAEPELAKRSQDVDCAQRLVRIIALDRSQPIATRAKAYYLSGNLEFLRGDYASAVLSYESALELIPAGADAGDDIAERAAWNRSIAKRRAEQQKPPPHPDAGTPPPGDGGTPSDDQKQDQKKQDQKDQDQKDQDQKDQDQNKNQDQDQNKDQNQSDQQQKDQQDKQDAQSAAAAANSAQPAPSSSAAPPERPSLSQDEQILDMLQRAPLIQQELPKSQGRVLGQLPMEDK